MNLLIREVPGRCRWCQCTDSNPCEGGCAWADRHLTVCTACVEVDRAVRTIVGRRALALFVQGVQDTDPGDPFVAPRPARRQPSRRQRR